MHPARVIYLLCARCNDSFKVLRAYPSRVAAEAMADLGDRLEVDSVTRSYIGFARSATSDEGRQQWVDAMMQIYADGVRYWRHEVREAEL